MTVYGRLALIIGMTAAGAVPALGATATAAQKVAVNQYCLTCHSARLKTGGLSLEGADVDRVAVDAATWEKVVRKLRLRTMPPLGSRRPDEATYESLTSWLEGELDSAALAHPNPGRPVLHRLNRAEYANAIRDLLGLNVDVAALLPPDDAAYGFDNVADALGSSPALLQAYLGAARKISAVAVGDPRAGVNRDTYSARQDLSQDHHLEGLPLGTQGGLVATHTFPVDGDYEFQLRLWRTNLSAMRGLQDPHQVEITLDGRRILLATLGGDEDLVTLQKNPTATSDEIEARLHVRVHVKAGTRTVAAAFLEETPWTLETARLQPFIRDFNSPFAAEGAPHVQSISVEGPYNAAPTSQPPSARLFVCRPNLPRRSSLDAQASEDGLSRRSSPEVLASEGGLSRRSSPEVLASEGGCARRIVTTVGRRAYRRPLTPAEVDGLMAFYSTARKGASFNAGVEFALRRILASPSFVFRPEHEPPESVRGYALSRHRLRAGVAAVVLPLEQHSGRRAAACRRHGDSVEARRAARAGAAHAGRPAIGRARRELRGTVAAAAQPARHRPEPGDVPRLRRQPAPGVPHAKPSCSSTASCTKTGTCSI